MFVKDLPYKLRAQSSSLRNFGPNLVVRRSLLCELTLLVMVSSFESNRLGLVSFHSEFPLLVSFYRMVGAWSNYDLVVLTAGFC